MNRWLKGFFILSTYAQVISNQRCITNRETPCRKNANVNQLNISSFLMYSAVQINVVKGCVSEVLAHAIFDHVHLDCRICSFRKWSVQS